MAQNLWNMNTPERFWLCEPPFDEGLWEEAFQQSLETLQLPEGATNIDHVLEMTLGEGRFGPDHWTLSFPKKTYYAFKPVMARPVIRLLRQQHHRFKRDSYNTPWPVEPRYAEFQFNVLRNVLELSRLDRIQFRPIWPAGKRFAFVLTHDIETEKGQKSVRRVADLEESLGFRSSFNFVPERYKLDRGLMDDLSRRGFEIGVHGLKHDGKLFASKAIFVRWAGRINHYLRDWNARGFRADLTIRQPEWMQTLEIDYDLSFFDTDPFEPIPGGTMSIWPFFIGHFVELPYTLVQDHTLISVLGETTPRIWLEKIEFIEQYHGMALLDSHPDYLREPAYFNIYSKFLESMREKVNYWSALPRDAARWWRDRPHTQALSTISLDEGGLCIYPSGGSSPEFRFRKNHLGVVGRTNGAPQVTDRKKKLWS